MMMMRLLAAVRPDMNDRNVRSVSLSVSLSVTHLSVIERKLGASQPRYCAV